MKVFNLHPFVITACFISKSVIQMDVDFNFKTEQLRFC